MEVFTGRYEQGGYALGNAGYIDPADVTAKNVKALKDDFYTANYPGNGRLWAEGYIDKRFKVGDQSLYAYSAGQNFKKKR